MRSPASLAFDVHGQVVRFEGVSPELAEAIRERLAWAPVVDDAAPGIHIRYAPFPLRAVGRGRTVYESPLGTARYDERADVLSVSGDGFALCCECEEGRVEIAVAESVERGLWLASRPLLTLALTETLKRRDLFPLHAGAVRARGAIVIAGPTGAGKSTLSIALARAGLRYMSDDLVLLAPAETGLRVLGFPEHADASPTTAGLFPELLPLAADAPGHGRRKHAVDVPGVFGAEVATAASPALIVFPRFTGSGAGTLEPISAHAALVRLAPDVLLTAPAASQRHLDAIADLVEASACYELAMGPDLAGVVQLVLEVGGRRPGVGARGSSGPP